MKKRIKKICLLSALIAGTIFFAACKDDDDGEKDSGNELSFPSFETLTSYCGKPSADVVSVLENDGYTFLKEEEEDGFLAGVFQKVNQSNDTSSYVLLSALGRIAGVCYLQQVNDNQKTINKVIDLTPECSDWLNGSIDWEESYTTILIQSGEKFYENLNSFTSALKSYKSSDILKAEEFLENKSGTKVAGVLYTHIYFNNIYNSLFEEEDEMYSGDGDTGSDDGEMNVDDFIPNATKVLSVTVADYSSFYTKSGNTKLVKAFSKKK